MAADSRQHARVPSERPASDTGGYAAERTATYRGRVFTGIVEELGHVVERDGDRLRIGATTVLDDVEMGASIAVNGCCLTVVAWGDDWWEAELTDETWSRTSLGDLAVGDPVNLERPVRLSDRLGGHLVQGHVDGVGEIVQPAPDLRVRCDRALLRYVVDKGSITVDGISLTVVDAARRRLHRGDHPAHRGGHHPRHQGGRGPRQPGGRRDGEVRREAARVAGRLSPRAGAAGRHEDLLDLVVDDGGEPDDSPSWPLNERGRRSRSVPPCA